MRDYFNPALLRNQTALVTGASRGLGRSIALGLAAAGAKLALTARDVFALNGVKAEIEQLYGGEALCVPADAADEKSVTDACAQTAKAFGGIDILVNNAGQRASYGKAPFENLTLEQWENMFKVNVTGLFLFSREAGKIMLARQKGVIINISSGFGIKPAVPFTCYNTAKTAVIGLTKSLALEWAPKGVRVNCIAPGSIVLDKNDFGSDSELTAINAARCRNVPMGYLCANDEITPAVVYLASDAARYVTGAVLPVDGGYSL